MEKLKTKTLQAFLDNESHYHWLASAPFVGIIKLDATGRSILYANQQAIKILGLTLNKLLTKGLAQAIHPHDREAIIRDWLQKIESGASYQGQIRLRGPKKQESWVICQAAPEKNEQGQIISYIGVLTDITELKKTQQSLHKLARHDHLTNLPNRLLFEETLERSLNRSFRKKQNLGLFYIDIDHFKKINDGLGHVCGDKLLVVVGNALKQNIRRQDFVARLGGDEFAIIFEDFDGVGNLYSFARRIQHFFNKPLYIDGHECLSTVSIGIAIHTELISKETLTQQADQALYQAKANGRNCFRFYTPTLQKKIERYGLLENHLRQALEKEEFEIYYQPRFDLANHQIASLEALLHWNNPAMGKVPAEEFIPMAEEMGLIQELGFWAIDAALKDYQQLCAKDFDRWNPIHIAINLSTHQFQARDFFKSIQEIFKKRKVEFSKVSFGLTEKSLIKNIDETEEVLNKINQLGIRVAVDDFGTGYASLIYLKKLPVSVLKIDKSFIRDIGKVENNEMIIKVILDLSRTLNIKVIAEGVETENQVKFLRHHGCELAQGHFFSKPLPLTQIEQHKYFK